MARRKRKYFINIPKAISFLKDAYGLNAVEVNFYHLKVRHPDFVGTYNWYHTRGTVVVEREGNVGNIGNIGTEEELALLINKHIENRLYGNRT
jgi:hypothetical protein